MQRCGRRRRAAVAAVLDQGAHDELRVVGGTVPAPPRLVEEARIAVARVEDLLGGSRLAGDRHGEPAEHADARPVRRMRRRDETLAHDVERTGVDVRRLGCGSR